MNKNTIATLMTILTTLLAGCASTRTNYPSGYNTDYVYLGKIYPGSVSNVSYGSDFGEGYGLNYGIYDYKYGYGVDDYGLGYGIVDYGDAGGYGSSFYQRDWSGWHYKYGHWQGSR
jgi:hypothetical protein